LYKPLVAVPVKVWCSCVDGIATFQAEEGLDGFAGFLLGEAVVVEGLEVEPELRCGVKKMR
jgi:hypothetical protein